MKRLLFSLLFLLLLAGCIAGPVPQSEAVVEHGGASLTGDTLNQEEAGSEYPFTIPVKTPGEPIGVDFRGMVTAGNLKFQLLADNGETVWTRTAGIGPFAINEVIRPEAAGEYRLGLAWEGAVQAQFNLIWQPGEIQVPVVTPLALIQGAGMIIVALGFILYAVIKRWGGGYLALGAAAWVVTVAIKFAIAIPLNPFVYHTLEESSLPAAISAPVNWIYTGILTGLTEVLLTYLFLRYTRLGKAVWERVLAFGFGFGAVEALLLGVVSLLSAITALLAPQTLPLDTIQSLSLLNNPLYGITGIWERFFTILVHIFTNVLIFYAVQRRETRWFWLAFIYKSGLDTVAAYAQLNGNLTLLWFLWAIEAFVAVMGILGWIGTRWIGKRYQEPEKVEI